MRQTAATSIERYLDRLLFELRGRATDIRRILEEAETHLRQSVDDGMTEAEAIERFGSPRVVARRFAPTTGAVVPDLVRLAWMLAAVGLIAIGASGVLSMGLRSAFGSRFVAGDPVGVTYTAVRCADYREYHPEAATCAGAASAHHADEVEMYRVLAGILGVIGLGVWRWKLRGGSDHLPIELGPTVATVAFGLAGAGLLAQGLSMLAEGTQHGAGQWLSAAIVALIAASFSGVRLLRELQVRAA